MILTVTPFRITIGWKIRVVPKNLGNSHDETQSTLPGASPLGISWSVACLGGTNNQNIRTAPFFILLFHPLVFSFHPLVFFFLPFVFPWALPSYLPFLPFNFYFFPLDLDLPFHWSLPSFPWTFPSFPRTFPSFPWTFLLGRTGRGHTKSTQPTKKSKIDSQACAVQVWHNSGGIHPEL